MNSGESAAKLLSPLAGANVPSAHEYLNVIYGPKKEDEVIDCSLRRGEDSYRHLSLPTREQFTLDLR
jgi:hypothetical protein